MSEILLPEIVAAGIYNAEIAHKSKTVTPPRTTSLFEIDLPIENGGISYINNEKQPISANTIICAKPGQTRHTRLPFQCYYVHMTIPGGKLKDLLMDLPNYIHTERCEFYHKLFSELHRHYVSFVEDEEIMMQSILLELIHTLTEDARKQTYHEKIRPNNSLIIDKTLQYIKNNLTEDLRLNTLAASVSLSPIHFHNCFKSATGKTLRDYVEEQRLKKSVDLLLKTDLSLTEIALECGFSSQSYFSYVFRRRMNATPREYVKEIFMRYDRE